MMIVQFVFSERRKNIHHLLKSNLFFLVSCFVRNASPITYRISKIKQTFDSFLAPIVSWKRT